MNHDHNHFVKIINFINQSTKMLVSIFPKLYFKMSKVCGLVPPPRNNSCEKLFWLNCQTLAQLNYLKCGETGRNYHGNRLNWFVSRWICISCLFLVLINDRYPGQEGVMLWEWWLYLWGRPTVIILSEEVFQGWEKNTDKKFGCDLWQQKLNTKDTR